MNAETEIALIHEELQNMNKKIQNQRLQVARLGGIATAAGVVGGLIVQLILKML